MTRTRVPRGAILYDGACGFCRSWVVRWEPTLRRRGFDVAPLQSPWVAERTGLSSEELLADLLLLRPDGSVVRGADVYREALKRIVWAWPLWVVSVLPIGRQVFDRAYRSFADHRYRISQACQLPSVDDPSRTERKTPGSSARNATHR